MVVCVSVGILDFSQICLTTFSKSINQDEDVLRDLCGKKYILLLVTHTFMSKQGFLMSETQNAQSTYSLRNEYCLIP